MGNSYWVLVGSHKLCLLFREGQKSKISNLQRLADREWYPFAKKGVQAVFCANFSP
jgi:hypothetical protein